MSIGNPKYQPGSVVYLRESAAAGFLESMTISGVQSSPNGWSYTVQQNNCVHPRVYGERRSLINNSIMIFDSEEFIEYHEALILIREYHLRSLSIVESKIAQLSE